ncbi:TPA: hypothetical protein ACSPY3_003018, partial [Escherichia coli]|nr:hypothetical protein ECYG_02143 [Escherichia coli B367]
MECLTVRKFLYLLSKTIKHIFNINLLKIIFWSLSAWYANSTLQEIHCILEVIAIVTSMINQSLNKGMLK